MHLGVDCARTCREKPFPASLRGSGVVQGNRETMHSLSLFVCYFFVLLFFKPTNIRVHYRYSGDHTEETFWLCCYCLQELFHSHLVFAPHTSGPLWCWITIFLLFFNFFEIFSTWLRHRTFSFGPVWPCFFPVIFCLWFWLVWYFGFLAD